MSSYWSPSIPWHVLWPWPDSILSHALSFSLELRVWSSTWLVRNKDVIYINKGIALFTYIYIYICFKTFFYVVQHLDSIASYLPTGLHLGFFRLLTKFSVTSKPRIWMDMVSYEKCTCETVMQLIQDQTTDHNLPICWFTQLHYSAQHVVPYHKYIKLSYERLKSAGFQPSNQNKCYCN